MVCYGSLTRLRQMPTAIRSHTLTTTSPEWFSQYVLLAHLEQADQSLTTTPWHGELGEGNA